MCGLYIEVGVLLTSISPNDMELLLIQESLSARGGVSSASVAAAVGSLSGGLCGEAVPEVNVT